MSAGDFSWTPATDQSGSYTVTFTVEDGQGGSDSETIAITVSNSNQPPVIASIEDKTVLEGSELKVSLSATDPDGNNLIYTLTDAPQGVTLNDSVLTWFPGYDTSGDYDVSVSVADDNGAMATASFRVVVNDVNRPPIIGLISDVSVTSGETVEVTISTIDPDGNSVSLSVSDLPPGATLQDSMFSWSPRLIDVGGHSVTFYADDGSGGRDTIAVAIAVTAQEGLSSPVSMDLDEALGDQMMTAKPVSVNESVFIEFHLAPDIEITGFGLKIEYDPTWVTIDQASFMPNFGPDGSVLPLVSVTEGIAQLGAVNQAEGGSTGHVATIKFDLPQKLKEPTNIILKEVTLKFSDRDDVSLEVSEVLILSPQVLKGDFDGNGVVDFLDFFSFADAFGTTDSDSAYDFDNDGSVGFSDFFIFADAFGNEERSKLIALARTVLGLPEVAYLNQNYPNPFNSTTTISYSISSQSTVVLSIYDLNGQLIYTVSNDHPRAGEYVTMWNGVNDEGDEVSSGTYLLRLGIGGFSTSSKMTLVR